jgi:hypothetical protein
VDGPKLKQAQRRGIASNKANADRFAANVRPVIYKRSAAIAGSLKFTGTLQSDMFADHSLSPGFRQVRSSNKQYSRHLL